MSDNLATFTTALTPLQQAHFDAIARARKVATREPHLITTFALGDEIESITRAASEHFAAGEIDAYAALHTAARRLLALIPA